ncbi:MAG: hypothetical protein QME59_05555, partial [Candidatus Hydrothermarchaeota archaeon]|nr:hypothetical protein [Candidatus Hydrothermarchaeota archaeon]
VNFRHTSTLTAHIYIFLCNTFKKLQTFKICCEVKSGIAYNVPSVSEVQPSGWICAEALADAR